MSTRRPPLVEPSPLASSAARRTDSPFRSRPPTLCGLALLLATGAVPIASAQDWESLNPGAGGQIQDVVLDPDTPDHAFVLSDVEGLYRTEDGGESWIYSSRGLAGTNTLSLAHDPFNGSRLYLGTTVGLHVSDDGGVSWRLQRDTGRAGNPALLTKTGDDAELAVGNVVVGTRDSQRVLASVGNKRDSFIGEAAVFRSTDGAASFEAVRFGPDSSADKSVLQLALAPDGDTVYAATAADGLWKADDFGATGRWSRLGGPSGADARVTGVAVAPDGTVYAAFGRAGQGGTALHASRDGGASWRVLDGTGRPDEANLAFRELVVDPRSDGRRHALLSAPGTERKGLWQIDVDWAGAEPVDTWTRAFWYDTRDSAPFPVGWEGGVYGNRPRPLAYRYTPLAWGGRGLWTTGDQTLFRVDGASGPVADWSGDWRQIYTRGPVATLGPVTVDIANVGPTVSDVSAIETWSDRGWASTVDMDVARVGDLVVRSGADHAVTLSHDGGRSWEDVSSPRRAKSQANAIVTQGGSTYLLAHFSGPNDFGATNTEGELWGARVDPSNPGPVRWYFLGGGIGRYGDSLGLANGIYTNIVADPFAPGRVYVASLRQGLYVIRDIGALYEARVNGGTPDRIARVPGSPGANEYEGSLVIDPNYPGTLYVAEDNELWRGVRDDSGGGDVVDRPWTWTSLLRSEKSRETFYAGDLMTFDAWDRGGRTVMAATATVDGVSGLYYGGGGDAGWQRVATAGELMARRAPAFDVGDERPVAFAVTGRGDRIWTTVQTFAPSNLGHGVYEVALSGEGLGGIRDVTGDLPFPKSFRTEVIADPVSGEVHLYLSSWGAGTWRLPIAP